MLRKRLRMKHLFSQIIKEDDTVVKCNTVEEKMFLYRQADKLGLKLYSGRSYLQEEEKFSSDISYCNCFKTGLFASYGVYLRSGYLIVNFEDIDFEEEEKIEGQTEKEKVNIKMQAIFKE